MGYSLASGQHRLLLQFAHGQEQGKLPMHPRLDLILLVQRLSMTVSTNGKCHMCQ